MPAGRNRRECAKLCFHLVARLRDTFLAVILCLCWVAFRNPFFPAIQKTIVFLKPAPKTSLIFGRRTSYLHRSSPCFRAIFLGDFRKITPSQVAQTELPSQSQSQSGFRVLNLNFTEFFFLSSVFFRRSYMLKTTGSMCTFV